MLSQPPPEITSRRPQNAASLCRCKAFVLIVFALALGLLNSGVALADSSNSFRGSSVSVRNTVSTLSLNKDAQLTYNPFYAVSIQVDPRYSFTESFYGSLSFGALREITNSDTTSEKGETVLNDLTLRIGTNQIAKIPGGLTLSGAIDGLFPTSKASQARTMLVGVRPSLRLAWALPGVKSLSLSYSLAGTWYAHEYTTSSRDVPLIPGCGLTTEGCDAYSHSGVRNTEWRLTNSVATSYAPTSWLSFAAAFVMLHDRVYDLEADDGEAMSYLPQEPSNIRYILAYDLSMTLQAAESLNVTLGASTANPQLAPDTSYYRPFYNRYTNLYLNLSLDIASLFASSPDRKDTP